MRSGEVCIYKDPKAWTSGFCNFFWQGMMSLVGGNQLPLASGRSTSASTPPILSPPSFDIERCITHYIHGDEGRGHLKRPYLVISGNLSLDIMVCRMQCGLCHGCCCAEICKNVNDNLESVGVMAQRQEIEMVLLDNGLAYRVVCTPDLFLVHPLNRRGTGIYPFSMHKKGAPTVAAGADMSQLEEVLPLNLQWMKERERTSATSTRPWQKKPTICCLSHLGSSQFCVALR